MIIKKHEGATISLEVVDAGEVFFDNNEYYIKTNVKSDGSVKAVRLYDGEIRTFWFTNEVESVDGYFQLN